MEGRGGDAHSCKVVVDSISSTCIAIQELPDEGHLPPDSLKGMTTGGMPPEGHQRFFTPRGAPP